MTGLNQGQQQAADDVMSFLFQPDIKEHAISGPGGAGKSHLMAHVIDEVIPSYHNTCNLLGIPALYETVDMTATTNKATEVLSNFTKRPCQTIYGLLGLKVQDDYSNGKQRITRKNNWQPQQNKIIFVDEASMVNSQLYQEINDGTLNCKIIYVGDHCQLKPVGEIISPVYRGHIKQSFLTQPMRTTIPELQALNQQLRNTVETSEFNPIQLVPGIIDLVDEQKLQDLIDQHFVQQNYDNRILAYSNSRVHEYNDYIRGLRGLPAEFSVGEDLVVSQAYQRGMEVNLTVEQEVTITELSDIYTTRIAGVDFHYREVGLATRLGGFYTGIRLPVDREHYLALVKYLGNDAKKSRSWSDYFDFKNSYIDLRQPDAGTVHKAQGSSLDYVFIDLENISTCRNPDDAARLLYVACSRARKRIFFYGNLAAKYGGLIH